MKTEAAADQGVTISRAEAARLIGVSPGLIKTLEDEQGLPIYSLGKRHRYIREEILEWLKSRRRVKHTPAPAAPESAPGRASSSPAVSDLDAEIRATRRRKGAR